MMPRSLLNPPGSTEAGLLGCLCPVMDNSYGHGFMRDSDCIVYVVTAGCPVHTEELMAAYYERNRIAEPRASASASPTQNGG